MQIYLSTYRLFIFLLVLSVIVACGADDDTSDSVVQPEPITTPQPVPDDDKTPEPIQYGTVSGIITDSGTKNPIPNVTVMLNDLEVKTEVDGVYTFQDIPYNVEHQLTVQDPDYQDFKHEFTLNQVRLTINVPLISKIDNEAELKTFFEDFSALIESVDPENTELLQAKFSETYVAGDDPATLFAIASGIIPQNYESVLPTVTALFETYSWIQFDFKQLEIDITHARKASIHTVLDIDSENAEDGDLSHIEARCEFEFRREETGWKIVHWEVLFLDVQM